MTKKRDIPLPIRCMLWGRAAGRCEFAGCNKPISFHPKTKEDVNLAEVAHIIGFSKDGPRGEKELSEELAKDISNLMLLCGDCHTPIDANKARYTVDLLRTMKKEHESRAHIVTGIAVEKQTEILLYESNIGQNTPNVSYEQAAMALMPEWYPARIDPISLGMLDSSFRDDDEKFWEIEKSHLRRRFAERVKPRIEKGNIPHLSVFAFAPQPLLILLGYLLSDIPAPVVEVYNCHREPQGWRWQEHPEGFEYIVEEPKDARGRPALVISLSATITDDRIKATLGDDPTIWRVTIPEPNNMFLKSRRQLQQFREIMRPLMDKIKAMHGESAVLNVFMGAPVAIAVEFGRIIMPKADLPLCIYDQNRKLGGFVKKLAIPDDKDQEV